MQEFWRKLCKWTLQLSSGRQMCSRRLWGAVLDYCWCEKQFLFSIYARKIMRTNSSHLTFNKKLNVLCGVTADGSRGIKWKWKDINARASATHGWRRLPLVTWLLCRACGWLGGPSGCAAPASELNDELCPGTPGTSAQLTRAHRRRKKTKLNKWKKMKCLAQGCPGSWWQRDYFSPAYSVFTQRAQAGGKTDSLTFTLIVSSVILDVFV